MGRTYSTITRRRWLRVRPAAAGDFGGPLRRLSFVATRPCGLACHGLRRAAAAFARRRLLRLQRFAGGQTPLPRPCPVPPPEKVRRSARHIGSAWWRARLYGAALRAGLAGHPVGPVIARTRRGRAARLRLPGRTMRGPPPSAAARPCLSASAPGGRAWRARPPRRRGAAPLATAAPRIPPCAGPGFWPGPLPTAGKPAIPLPTGPHAGQRSTSIITPQLAESLECSIIEQFTRVIYGSMSATYL